jgi:hypothetical protein
MASVTIVYEPDDILIVRGDPSPGRGLRFAPTRRGAHLSVGGVPPLAGQRDRRRDRVRVSHPPSLGTRGQGRRQQTNSVAAAPARRVRRTCCRSRRVLGTKMRPSWAPSFARSMITRPEARGHLPTCLELHGCRLAPRIAIPAPHHHKRLAPGRSLALNVMQRSVRCRIAKVTNKLICGVTQNRSSLRRKPVFLREPEKHVVWLYFL